MPPEPFGEGIDEEGSSSDTTGSQHISKKRPLSLEIMDSPLLEDELSNGDDEPSAIVASDSKPSNEKLLGTAFISFLSFASVQAVFAFIAGSQAMMGDSAAMMVDALTYGFNWLAERQKANYVPDPELSARIQQRNLRKTTLQWELIPPLISVSTLIVVTIFVLKKSIRILILDSRRNPSEQQTPNVDLMLAFSVLNLVLDVVNVGCFASADHALGYSTTDDRVVSQADDSVRGSNSSNSRFGSSRESGTYGRVSTTEDNSDGSDEDAQVDAEDPPELPNYDDIDEATDQDDEVEANLNMCSAYTHVFADTLRSFAVIIAASVALLFEVVTPEVADATAAVIVSVLIGLSLIPLFQGLRRTWSEYRAILSEERSEHLAS